MLRVASVIAVLASAAAQADCAVWEENTNHSATAFRNVRDFGAKGDGVTDDTAAFMTALTQGRQVGPSLQYPMTVYVPPGTYVITSTLPIYFLTDVRGNWRCRPTLLVPPNTPHFQSGAYLLEAVANAAHVSSFYHQILNIDITVGSGNDGLTAIHWPVAQATSLRNMTIDLSAGGLRGYFSEDGGGGFIGDVTVIGGQVGWYFGGQQWQVRNMNLTGQTNTALQIIWNWLFVFQGLHIANAPIGIQFTGSAVGSIVLIDSTLSDVYTGIVTDYPAHNRSILFDRVVASNVNTICTGSFPGNLNGVINIPSWRQGPAFASGVMEPSQFGPLPTTRPDVPLPNIAMPTFGDNAGGGVYNAYDAGAKGDGVTDDTAALQKAINTSPTGVVFLPHGTYVISSTLNLLANTALIGETFSILTAAQNAPAFADASKPTPMLLTPTGTINVRLANLLIFVQYDAPGLVTIQWQGAGGGLWDVHWRLYAAGNIMFHITGQGAGYFESMWIWSADHDIDGNGNLNVTNPRGLVIDSTGPVYLMGTASEHHEVAQYEITNAGSVTILMAQTETNYDQSPPTGWALNATNSNLTIYGTGFYAWPQFEGMQYSLINIVEGSAGSTRLYDVNTYGALQMLTGDRIISNKTDDWFCSAMVSMIPF